MRSGGRGRARSQPSEPLAWSHDVPPGATGSRRSRPTARCSTPGSRRPRSGALPDAVEPHIVPAELEPWLGDGRSAATCESSSSRSRSTRRGRRPRRRTPTCACTCCQPPARRAQHDQPRRHLRPPADRRAGRPPAPCIPTLLRAARARLQRAGISALGIDKFPRLLDYVVPDRVRIADASRVRLGAYLSPGTTVHARGLRQLQRGHARRLDGRGPHLAGRRRRRRLRHRRRRLDHGHPVGRRHRAGRRSASARCSAPTPASASRSATTRSSRPGST